MKSQFCSENRENVAKFRNDYYTEIEKIHTEIQKYYALIEECLHKRRDQMTLHNTSAANSNTEIQEVILNIKDRDHVYSGKANDFNTAAKQVITNLNQDKEKMNKWDVLKLVYFCFIYSILNIVKIITILI